MQFGVDWTTDRVPHWLPYVQHLPGTPCRLLEIGSLEGRTAVWMLENLCTHLDSRLTCIDPWSGDKARGVIGAKRHEQRFDANIKETGRAAQVIKCKGYSQDVLPRLKGPIHLAYIDGSHEARNLVRDWVLLERILLPGSLVIFDDYQHNDTKVRVQPRVGIDFILHAWADQFELLLKGWQVIVRKKS